jgi:hypothetical protein
MTLFQQRRDLIRRWYGFDFPEDFYHFWECANRLRPLDPLHALDELGILLTGPFDFMYGRCDRIAPPLHPYLHWRYYADPPEFFTVLVGGDDGHHWGYYLDAPPSPRPSCITSYYARDALEFVSPSNTLFKAVRLWIEEVLADYQEDPDILSGSDDTPARCNRIRTALMRYQTADRPETGAEYVEKYRRRPHRFRHVVAPTHDQIGVVVPHETYCEPAFTEGEIGKLIWDETGPNLLFEEAREALRDGCPGTTLKLGKDLWVNPTPLAQDLAYELLDTAYVALGRDLLRDVLRVHRLHRDRPWLDIFHTPDPSTATEE